MAEPVTNSSFTFSALPSRRRFLRAAGTTVAASLVLAACGDDDPEPVPTSNLLSLGAGDVGIMSYLYRLKQLQAEFYQKVITAPPTGMTTAELDVLKEIALHEQVQRDFLRALLEQNSQVALLLAVQYSFASFEMTTRQGVLSAARQLEDLGVAAMNGVGNLISTFLNLNLVTKITSVEARHAATVRNLLTPGSFAGTDVVNTEGLDKVLTPTEGVVELNKFSSIPFTAAFLPTS
ncbi:ferritin-like domain-containing protein [Hymenobacter koreensis]|uniref:Ferritin-like domain-containing protein n=1 Tax=Hymenobacter koreensis TaxID=1084523 RepID=A0ABP8IW79_9BACT